MNPLIRILAISTLTLAWVAQTHAGPKGSAKPSTAKPPVAAKSTTATTFTSPAKTKVPAQGVKFANGFLYKGKNHHQWGPIRWDRRYGCYCYWDPCVLEWYYWCEPDDCYYPVSYCPYRTYCNVGVAEIGAPVSQPVTGEPRTTVRPDAQPMAPLSSDIAPIPEPVAPRK